MQTLKRPALNRGAFCIVARCYGGALCVMLRRAICFSDYGAADCDIAVGADYARDCGGAGCVEIAVAILACPAVYG